MNSSPGKRQRIYRRVLFIYLCILSMILIRHEMHNLKVTDGMTLGDWLINYSGGFVRRGFSGEIFLLLGRWLHIAPQNLVPLPQLLLYGIIFFSVWKLTEGSDWSLWEIAIVFSPATLAFPIFRASAGFRKEEIFFATLGILILLILRGTRTWILSLFLTCACSALVLSHEAMLIYFPYLFAALGMRRHELSNAVRIAIAPAIASAIAAIACITHQGTRLQAIAICSSLGDRMSDPLCSGAISMLVQNIHQVHRDIIAATRNSEVRLYPFLYALALLPAGLGLIQLAAIKSLRYQVTIIVGCSGLAMAGSSVLFYYAFDWGRWVMIHLFSLMLLLLYLDRQRRALTPAVPIARRPNSAFAAIVLVSYLTTWNLPFFIAPAGGYLGIARHLMADRATSLHWRKFK
jgi:hypothetical protein